MMKAKDQSKSLFFVIFSTLMIGSILVEGFTHYPFLVERFRKLDDNNAEEHTSENIQHCLGLFLRFCKSVSFENVNFEIFMLEYDCIVSLYLRLNCKLFSLQKPDCVGFSFRESNRKCWLSEGNGLSLTDSDHHVTYKKISDDSLNSPAGGSGQSNPAPVSVTVESRKTTKTDPISMY